MELEREDAQEFVRHVNSILGALARSLEQLAFGDDQIRSESVQDAYLQLQKIGFQFKATCGRLSTRYDFDRAVSQLAEDIAVFGLQTRRVLLGTSKVRVSRLTQKARLSFLHPALTTPRTLPAFEVVHLLEESLQAALREAPFRTEGDPDDDTLPPDIEAVRRAIPNQRVAPAQFEISGSVLRVRAQSRSPKKDTELIAGLSLEALLQQGAEIQNLLEAGNVDRRLARKVGELNEALKSKENIIKLGLQNITCSSMAKALSKELPDAVSAQIEGFCTGLGMYIAQFEEWQTFVQNAVEASINEKDSEGLRSFADTLLQEMSLYSEAVDPEVPQTIRFLTELLDDPRRASKRAVFAFIRTIENLVIEAFGFVLETISATAQKTTEKVAEKGSSYITRALIAIGLVSATGLLPVSAQVKGMEWIEAAYHAVRDQVAPKVGGF
jgi:hypothetical protein